MKKNCAKSCKRCGGGGGSDGGNGGNGGNGGGGGNGSSCKILFTLFFILFYFISQIDFWQKTETNISQPRSHGFQFYSIGNLVTSTPLF